MRTGPRSLLGYRESIHLTGEPEAGGRTRRQVGNQMVQVNVCRLFEIQRTEANVIEGLIVNAVGLISTVNRLM
jgi:hypothetical protein